MSVPSRARWRFPEKLDFLFQPARFKVAYGGRGGCKSWGFARALLIRGWQEPLRIVCAREIQNSIQDSVHRLLTDQIGELELDEFYRVQENRILGANGSEFIFAGLRQQDVNKIKSLEGCDICWVEEAQVVMKKSWNTLTPTIRKPGSEIWVSFNPELDTDETYQRFVVHPSDDAVVVNINWSDNPWLPDELRKDMADLRKRDPEEAEHIWDGKCKTVVAGAIYKREIEDMHTSRRFRPVPYDPILKVHCIYDLGWNDQLTIIFAQRAGSELRIIDYIEDSHRTLQSYVAELKSKPYVYGHDWIPHDGKAGTIASGGASSETILRGLGRSVRVLPRGDVEEGIKAARLIFPRCYFDQDQSVRLVDCLKRYRRAVNQQTNEPGAPVHDEYSHGADAFRYLATIADQLKNDDESPRIDMSFRPSQAGQHAWMG